MKIKSVNFLIRKNNINFGNQKTYEKGYKRGVILGQSNAQRLQKPNNEPPSVPNYKDEDNKSDYILGYKQGYQDGFDNPYKEFFERKSKDRLFECEGPALTQEQIDENNAELQRTMAIMQANDRLLALTRALLRLSLPGRYTLDEEEERQRRLGYPMYYNKDIYDFYDDDK